jgi:phosphatidylserine/phosphatidylglycerophosphate/cardiolipin synthase-like enzyme
MGYSGSDSYKFIDRLIKRHSGTLRIVSPYIGPYYAKMLVSAAMKGSVYVITSSSTGQSESQQTAIRILQRAGKRNVSKKVIAYFALLLVISFAIGSYAIIALIALLFIIALYVELRRSKHPKSASNLFLKIATKRFVHEKLYISNLEAITGSANLTYNGTHKNIEHIEVVKDDYRIKVLSDHFSKLWSD